MVLKKGRRTSTPRLAIWAVAMFLLGLGLGTLFTSQGCRKKGQLPEAEERAPAKPAAKGAAKLPRSAQPLEAPQGPAAPKVLPPAEPHAVAKAAPQTPALPRIALVIDDLGYAVPELVTRLCAQPIAFSVAVLPFQEYTRTSAELAHERGKEVLLHLPMEPVGYPGPGKDPGPQAIFYDLPEAEIRARVRKALFDIPFRKGVNNHMGSRITPDRLRMTWILEEIRARHCFFVDSRTEKDSVAFAVAQALAIPTIERKVFLDDDKRFPEIQKQWDRALALAQKDGQALIIGHIYPETVEALEKLIPTAHGKVTFVFAGDLVK